MRFEHKAALQQVLSRIPLGDEINFAFQRHVVHTLPRRESGLAGKVLRARQHLERFRKYSPDVTWSEAHLLEIGAGWDFLIALTYAMCGIGRQSLIDWVPHFKLELINDSLRRLEAYRPELESALQITTRSLGGPVRSPKELADRLNIHIFAPMDARKTTLESGTVDLVTSTSTMEHLPAEQIHEFLSEWTRLLTPDGLLSCHIDLKDHLCHHDRRINYYNFLQYSPAEWRRYNPSIAHQNRLRASEFVELFTKAKFELLEVEEEAPTPEDEAILAAMRIHPDFARFSMQDLGAKIVWIVARPNR